MTIHVCNTIIVYLKGIKYIVHGLFHLCKMYLFQEKGALDCLMDFVNNTTLPWIVRGDFNAILQDYERVGCSSDITTSMLDFNAFVMVLALTDGGYT